MSFAAIFGNRKLQSLQAVSVEHRLVTDRQTDRHDYGTYRASMASRGKKRNL